jgi:hypothetical protein
VAREVALPQIGFHLRDPASENRPVGKAPAEGATEQVAGDGDGRAPEKLRP